MQKSKLIHYLSKFSKQDLLQFRDFVHSPYFNKHKKTREFTDYILSVKTWDSPKLNKDRIFKKLFPKQEFEEQLLSNLASYTLRLIRQFYTQKQNEKDATNQQLKMLEASLNAGQEKLFTLSIPKLNERLHKTEIQNSNLYLQQSKFAQLLDVFDLQYGNRNSGKYIEKALSDFDIYFISEKLRMTCQMLARQQVTGQEYAFPFTEEILDYIEGQADYFRRIPSVWNYFLIYQMMSDDNTEYYYQVKNRLKTDALLFTHQEGQDLYTHVLNYCIRRLNLGETGYRKETFDIYQQMLESGLLYSEGILPPRHYTNIVSLGCDIKENERTMKFINEQKGKLPIAERDNTYTYNLAALHYSQQRYQDAIPLLQKVAFTDVYYNLLTRILMLKIYFETNNGKALESTLETFRIYLLRNSQISGSRRKSGLNLLRFTKKLFRLKEERLALTPNDFKKKQLVLESQIRGVLAVLNRAWLLEKVKKMD